MIYLPTDWRGIQWAQPDPKCVMCKGNPYWGKTLSSWDRCACVKGRTKIPTCV